MKIKKLFVGLVALSAAVMATACSSNSSSSGKGNSDPKELNFEFVPSVQVNKVDSKTKPLQEELQKELGIPVHVTATTNYDGLLTAMQSKKVDAGFMPPDAYVLAHKKGIADVLLQAERYGYDEPSGVQNKTLMHAYRAGIYVKKGSQIKSWKDLKGKKIAVQAPTSSSGYVFPIVELYQKGLNALKDCKVTQINGADQAIISVANGDVDAAFTFADARPIAAKDDPKIMKEVVPIYFTKWIPNDTISVRKGLSKSFKKKLATAFKKMAKTKKGQEIIENIDQHYGYVDAKDSDFNTIRQYQKELNAIQK